MTIVKMHNKKLGITYVYESESYWDKEKKQPRNRRKLIGKIDPETGEIIPTGKVGRRPSIKDSDLQMQVEPNVSVNQANMISIIDERNTEIIELRNKIKELESKCEHYKILIARIRTLTANE